tara:strand:- start:327 stop:1016 length:690 start_codon:yes stop_codon:yes gene_type:complete
MTNLSTSKKKKEIITPEKSLLFVPIIMGILVFSTLLAAIYRPLTNKLSEEEAQINLLKEKISYIPIYKKYINSLSINKSKAKKQQERLIALISDPQELKTILSEINRICIENRIEIVNIVPKPIVKYNQTSGKGLENLSTNNSSNKDPFLIPSIEKHMFKLTLKGKFNSLIEFLKELELLQSIAISDKIDIKADSANSNKDNLKLTMSFNLTTYASLKRNNTIKLETNN